MYEAVIAEALNTTVSSTGGRRRDTALGNAALLVRGQRSTSRVRGRTLSRPRAAPFRQPPLSPGWLIPREIWGNARALGLLHACTA